MDPYKAIGYCIPVLFVSWAFESDTQTDNTELQQAKTQKQIYVNANLSYIHY